MHDSYSAMLSVLAQCRLCSLRRVGLVLTQNGHERTLGLSSAAFWKEQKESHGKLAALKPLYLDRWDKPAFLQWFAQKRPQAVVSSSALIDEIAGAVDSLGLQIPQDISLLSLNLQREGRYAGIDQDFYQLGVCAVRMVIDKLMRNDRGVPAVRQTVLIPGKWVQGRTLVCL